MKRFLSGTMALLAATALVACEDSGGSPLTPEEPQIALSGTWAASPADVGEFGAITFQADTADISRDMIAEGASIVLGLHPNGTTSGRLLIPANADGVPDFDEDLTGTWTVEDGVVHLDHDADTFLRDMPFQLDGNRLVGDEQFGGVRVRLELERVTAQGDGNVTPGPGGFEIAVDVAVMESFPVQLAGSMTFTNPGSEERTLQTDVCWPLLRAYRPGEDTPVWDQLEEGSCAMLQPRTDVVQPDASIRFQTPVASAADILDDELPDGTYRIAVYFQVMGEGEIEREAGEVELAVPR
jgi:hypothetical protein